MKENTKNENKTLMKWNNVETKAIIGEISVMKKRKSENQWLMMKHQENESNKKKKEEMAAEIASSKWMKKIIKSMKRLSAAWRRNMKIEMKNRNENNENIENRNNHNEEKKMKSKYRKKMK